MAPGYRVQCPVVLFECQIQFRFEMLLCGFVYASSKTHSCWHGIRDPCSRSVTNVVHISLKCLPFLMCMCVDIMMEYNV